MPNLVKEQPTDVLQVRIVDELHVLQAHPLAELFDAECTNVSERIAVSVIEDALERKLPNVAQFFQILIEL